ncbi:TetR/AcrR family transcriptional regulator [Rhodococcus artemisiae]|uniref:TetR/AcrR family transcriptional regulator n=1 Tax=Rhodococcus artemisiae TaxID=714159 RepID=A0ABU7LFJ7_9NOCA|nr:TetR/AcrR family transcriptional regulator [Rhodococcus artemisiae]MEE2060336.1 TetR/AcrR family transcriptional regulator [Rhodococcus artemisiae]
MDTSGSTPQAWGRDEVRRAVLRAARSGFAAKGTSVTIREIASAAGVNLGLVHKHVGNKEDILRAVLERDTEVSTAAIEAGGSVPDAVRRLFDIGLADREYVRISAWLLLEGRTDLLLGNQVRGMAAVRGVDPHSHTADVRLMTALAAISGWSLFSEGILAFTEADNADRDKLEGQMSELLATILELPQFAPEPPSSPLR